MGACFGSEAAYEEMYGPIREEGDAPKKAPEKRSEYSYMTTMMGMLTPYAFGSQFTDLAVKVRVRRARRDI
jgi:hypothetical protein